MSRRHLLSENELKPLAIALSETFESINFTNTPEDPFKENLAQLKEDLLSNALLPAAYYQHHDVARAMRSIEYNNQPFLLGLLKIWYKQPHTFSTFQKALFIASSVVLLAAAVLSREIVVLLLDGKPKLKATGSAIADYCTTGLSDKIVEICANLSDGVTAVFNMNDPIRTLPSYLGAVNDTLNGPVPSTSPQIVPSWFTSSGWINFFTCTQANNATEMVGHAYFGTADNAIAKASTGFPVARTVIDGNPNPLISYIELSVLIPLFLAGLCIKIQEGGYSTFTNMAGQDYGHFNGYERGATSFEESAYAFAGTYGGIAGVALMLFATLLTKKACAKWDNSEAERNELKAIKKAHHLFKTLCKKGEETRSIVVATL